MSIKKSIDVFLLTSERRHRCLLPPPHSTSYWNGSLSKCNMVRKGNKTHIQIENEEIKLSLFEDDMIAYTEISKESKEKFLKSPPQTSKWL